MTLDRAKVGAGVGAEGGEEVACDDVGERGGVLVFFEDDLAI